MNIPILIQSPKYKGVVVLRVYSDRIYYVYVQTVLSVDQTLSSHDHIISLFYPNTCNSRYLIGHESEKTDSK